ncbi:MAG TPA: N-acetyltransferase [Candidatus Omnitrophica bacterium]|nr:N-acetyltransferase [Candidatus Omnitrophota bacterium]
MTIRKAKIQDVDSIYKLLEHFSKRDLLLPRSLSELYDTIRDFVVAEEDGRVIGCCALHPCWEDLGEIKSLAVDESSQNRGVGRKLVNCCLEEANQLGLKRVFALTYIPDFFKGFGFKETLKEKLPHKVWKECLACPKFPDCGEVALIKII